MTGAVLISTRPADEQPSILRDVLVIFGWFVALSVLYWVAVLTVCGRPGLPLDDAFIHLQFARNLYERGEMAFIPGVPSSGSTAPLYPVLIAAVYHVVRNWYLASFLLGALCSLGTALATYGIIYTWTGRSGFARWAGTLAVLAGPTVVQAYSGMEAAAYSLVFLIGLWLYGAPSRRLIGSGVLALGVWLRPELAVMLPLILLERAVAVRRQARSRIGPWLSEAWPHLAIWGAMACAYVSYHWHQDHHLMPSTFEAKVLIFPPLEDVKPDWLDSVPAAVRNHRWGVAILALTAWPFLILVLVGVGIGTLCLPIGMGLREAIGAGWRDDGPAAAGWRLAILTLVGYPFLRGMVDSLGVFWFQQHRYYAHITPLAILTVLGALPATGTVVRRRWWNWSRLSLRRQRRRTYGWAAAYTVLLGAYAVISVSNITFMQVRVAQWLRTNSDEGQLIATNDIGAIGFISRRPILDTVGLIEPDLVAHYLSGGDLLTYLQRRDPAYVAIFPNWYEELAARADLLEPVFDAELDFNVVCGGRRMVVYRPLW